LGAASRPVRSRPNPSPKTRRHSLPFVKRYLLPEERHSWTETSAMAQSKTSSITTAPASPKCAVSLRAGGMPAAPVAQREFASSVTAGGTQIDRDDAELHRPEEPI